MTVSTIDNIVFSRTCRDIIITNAPATFTIQFEYHGRKFGFDARPFSGSYRLKLSEILRALENETILPKSQNTVTLYAPETLIIRFGQNNNVECTRNVRWIPGYCSAEDIANELLAGHYWWTFRSQNAKTYKFAKEYLQTRISTSSSLPFKLTFHFKKKGKVVHEWTSFSSSDSTKILQLDLSYKTIRQIADEIGYKDDELLAYDISGGSAQDKPVGQRFIVAPNDRKVRAFCFRNSLGAFDTVYSCGEVNLAIESERKSFITSRQEIEIGNVSKEVIKVDTGYIATRRELNLWYEFLRSYERYLINSDGTMSRIVVDDSDSQKTLHAVGSLNFKFRMSVENEGYEITTSRLEEFSDEFT